MCDTILLDAPAVSPSAPLGGSPATPSTSSDAGAFDEPAPGTHVPEEPASETTAAESPPLDNPETISADQLHRILTDTFVLGQQVKRRFLGALLTLHVTKLHFLLGSPSTFEYASRHFGYEKSETYEMLRVAAALPGLPRTDEAFETGTLGWSAIKEVTRIADAETEEEWLALAAKSTVRVLRAEVESALAEKRRRPRQNRYGLPRLPVQVSFRLLPEQHELLQGALTIAAREMSVALGVESVKAVDALIYLATRVIEGQKAELPTSDAVREAFKPYRILYRTCPCCRTSQIATPAGWVDVPWEVVRRVEDDAEKIVLPLEAELQPQVLGGAEAGAAPVGEGAPGDATIEGRCPCCDHDAEGSATGGSEGVSSTGAAAGDPAGDPGEDLAEEAAGVIAAEAPVAPGDREEGRVEVGGDEVGGDGGPGRSGREEDGASEPPAEEAPEASREARDAADGTRKPEGASRGANATGDGATPGETTSKVRRGSRAGKPGAKAAASSGGKAEPQGGTKGAIVKDRPNTPALRRRVLARDGDRCTNPHCCNLADMSHHLVFLSKGGKTVEANEVGECKCCHALVHLGKLRARGNPMTGVTYTTHADELNVKFREERARLATIPLVRVVVVDRASAAGLPPDPAGPRHVAPLAAAVPEDAASAPSGSSPSGTAPSRDAVPGGATPAPPPGAPGVTGVAGAPGASSTAPRSAARDPDIFELPLEAMQRLGWSRKESLERLRVAFAELSASGARFGENELFNKAIRVRRAEIVAA